jgi:quercetin dioxygenase-like cupin family protein
VEEGFPNKSDCIQGRGCAVRSFILLWDSDTVCGGKNCMVVKSREDGWTEMREGVLRQSLAHGDKTHMVKFRLQAGVEIPTHEHPHEQTGFLLQGKMIMVIEGEECPLEAGDSWSLRGGVPHGVKVLDECLVLEIFSPVREEYMEEEVRL